MVTINLALIAKSQNVSMIFLSHLLNQLIRIPYITAVTLSSSDIHIRSSFRNFFSALFEVKLPYDPVCPSVGWMTGRSNGRLVVLSFIFC